MRTKLLAVAATAALVTALTPGTASAHHSWNGYHWARTSNPFTVKLGNNLSNAWDPYLRTTSTDWSKSAVLNTTIVAGQTRPRRCSPTAGRVEVCNAAYGQTGWLGVATVSVNGKHITRGTVKVNDTYFSLAKYNTAAWRNLVMCQEVGHTFGLAHQDENTTNPNLGTCMDYTDRPSTNQHPNQHDYDQLANIYRHLDSTTTVGQTADPSPGQAAVGNDAASWGTRVEGSRASGHSTYVRDLGRGTKVITFVTWA